MLILVFQKDDGKCYKWGMFDDTGKALEFVNYIRHCFAPSQLPKFFVAVATPGGIKEYTLDEFVEQNTIIQK